MRRASVEGRSDRVPSVGVIGGGIFGVSAALELRSRGFDVVIHESRGSLLQGATARNLFRIHRGFHYPRDEKTARQASTGFDSFVRAYDGAVRSGEAQYYAIADRGSRTSVSEFERHCRQIGLRAEVVDRPTFLTEAVERSWHVHEPYFDPAALRKIVARRLRDARVQVVLGSDAGADEIARRHDFLVLAVYADTNEMLRQLGLDTVPLQYELCEVPVVRSRRLRDRSVVVMDGPFVSLAPYRNRTHLLYDVQHSVHERVTATSKPAFTRAGQELAGRVMSTSGPSNLDAIVDSASRYITPLDGLDHLGSLYSVRVVPPDSWHSDARPTSVGWVSSRVLVVLSGKIATCVDAARTVGQEVVLRSGVPASLDGRVETTPDAISGVS